MLEKSKIWISSNAHLVVAVVIVGGLFGSSLQYEWVTAPFLLVFALSNFYFLKASKALLITFLAPLPFILAPVLFGVANTVVIFWWLIALAILWRTENYFWQGYTFLIILTTQLLLGTGTFLPVIALGAAFLIIFLVNVVINGQSSTRAFIHSLITSQVCWLAFFLPLAAFWRSVLTFAVSTYLTSNDRIMEPTTPTL